MKVELHYNHPENDITRNIYNLNDSSMWFNESNTPTNLALFSFLPSCCYMVMIHCTGNISCDIDLFRTVRKSILV